MSALLNTPSTMYLLSISYYPIYIKSRAIIHVVSEATNEEKLHGNATEKEESQRSKKYLSFKSYLYSLGI